jgi:transposase-like protein
MDLEKAAAEFRTAARQAGPRGAGRRYPSALRRADPQYFRRRRAAGASIAIVAQALGVRRQTLLAWAAEPDSSARPAFLPVSVVADPPPPARSVTHGPGGLRIEGLDVASVVALLRGVA